VRVVGYDRTNDRTRLAFGAFLAGFVLFWVWILALASAHKHGMRNFWLVGFLPQVLVGLILAAAHRWAYLLVAAGMLAFPAVDLIRHGPYADCALAAGWPVALGGLIAVAIGRYLRRKTTTA